MTDGSNYAQRDLLRNLVQSPQNPCFVCAPGNPHGLHVHFDLIDGTVQGYFTPQTWHQGWQGVVHGGILAALLDEAMAYTLFFSETVAVTARMDLRYRLAAKAGDHLHVRAAIVRESRRMADIQGHILREGRVLVESTARFIKQGRLDLDSFSRE